MAIADAEPKKSEVDVTSTGSSSSSKEMKKPRGPIKYSSLKDFSFSVSDVWDDRNISTFIECCHANFEDLKNHNGSEENKVWEKIAKSGLERSGSVNCFNVNYCLELAKCLKSFVSKNEKKMMDNEIFKLLYDKVVDLLPYFGPVSPARNRSRSKSVENSKSEKEMSTDSKGDHLTIPPFGTPSESTQALRIVAKILSKYKIDEFIKVSSRNAIWKEVTTSVEKDFGVSVNPRAFLEGYKRSVVAFVRSHPDPKERAKIFLEQIDDLLPFFDHIAPRSMKKSEFLSTAVEKSEKGKELVETNVDTKKRKEPEDENHDDSSSTKSKRRLNSGGESVADSGDIPLTTNTTTPLRTYLKKRTVTDGSSDAKKSKFCDDSDESCPGALDFLDDWNLSNDETIEQPQEEAARAPNESEQTHLDAVKVTKKRNRKAKHANKGPAPVPKPETTPIKKVLPSRQARSKKDPPVDVPHEEQARLDSAASPPVSSSKELVPLARILPAPLRKEESLENKELVGSVKHKIDVKKKDAGTVVFPTMQHDFRESEDSEIEDVPLMGTNIRVHALRGKAEQSKSHSSKRNMNPVVLLDKIPADRYLPSSSARTKPHFGSLQHTRPGRKRAESTESGREQSYSRGSSSQDADNLTVMTLDRPKRGRPKKVSKTPMYRTRAVPLCEEPTQVETATSVELVRQTVRTSTIQPVDRNYIVRELENSRPSTAHSNQLMSMAPPSTSLAPRTNPEVNPPEWFERFVMETRRHEMWKVHQLMKMQQELLDSECKKRGVLDKILAALSDRS